VRQPGLYNGLSSDSVLHYLDAAGGIDPERGSYLDVQVLRGGATRANIDLYRFLLEGRIDALQLQDGDTVLVVPRRHTVRVGGDVDNAAVFELREARASAQALLALARPKASATHLAVVRMQGAQRRSEYHPIGEAANVGLGGGDELTVTSDKVPGTILVRIDGAHRGQRTAVLPYGARLKDAQALLQPSPQARTDALQLFRKSIAARQKEMLAVSLDKLQTQALTARSATNEEAALRAKEAELVLQFTEHHRTQGPARDARPGRGRADPARRRRHAVRAGGIGTSGAARRSHVPRRRAPRPRPQHRPVHRAERRLHPERRHLARAADPPQRRRDRSRPQRAPAARRRADGAAQGRHQEHRNRAWHHADHLPDRHCGEGGVGALTRAPDKTQKAD
jgi:protein involved in polysaccharide export with SLBB domain